ncbi:hypothetical protein PAAG_08106 [Paracoccidioides lutzii Pb01]|uniref:Uncharacterized protein n=1 Tax=Paracoccidioides lutzii (strain ATCC MYA-826 / Pb01) TaxID=502779 RepID=C1HBG5_PARBA|nr:hypothetical protein PAAG_08106 [Paracoccidioides lutzii Pb01]EEH37688.1 hypothetical protein PAAG_08106 [Paracoccidioides lutzii Pb01]
MKSLLSLSLLLVPGVVLANVEKVFFTALKPSPLLLHQSLFDDLEIERLSPHTPSVRTYISAAFPSKEAPLGFESWFYLDFLNPGQRYEVRICYLATQPTSFTLTTHALSEILESPSLISSLTTFSTSHLPTLLRHIRQKHQEHHDSDRHEYDKPKSQSFTIPPKLGRSARRSGTRSPTSSLFLQVHAAAEYFTLDKGLMEDVPPVHVDVILDPYVLNVFPKSLLPTAAYIFILAVAGCAISWLVWAGVEVAVSLAKTKRKGGLTDGNEEDKGHRKKHI